MFSRLSSFQDLSKDSILSFFNDVKELKARVKSEGWAAVTVKEPKLVAQIFFEPSTRTRMSFELAAQRLGLKFSHFQMDSGTSVAKGETIYDSLRVLECLNPDLIIYRSKEDEGLNQFLSKTKIPYICAGMGAQFHPTQALIDIYTLYEALNADLAGLKLLFVGDTKNSRVVGSHLELAKIMGYQVLQFSDAGHSRTGITNVSDLKQTLPQVQAVIRLRTQKERGSEHLDESFKITKEQVEANNFLLMHPGPFLRGEDFESDLPEHDRSLIWKQKENGLFVRAAIFKKVWGR